MKLTRILFALLLLCMHSCYKETTTESIGAFGFGAERSHFNYREVAFKTTTYVPLQSVVWDFGDGTASMEKNPVHHFPSVGQYTVRCIAQDENNKPFTAYQTINISDAHVERYFVDTLIYEGRNETSSNSPATWSTIASSNNVLEELENARLKVTYDSESRDWKIQHWLRSPTIPFTTNDFNIVIHDVEESSAFPLPQVGVYQENTSDILIYQYGMGVYGPDYLDSEGDIKSSVHITRSDSILELNFISKLFAENHGYRIFRGSAIIRSLKWYY